MSPPTTRLQALTSHFLPSSSSSSSSPSPSQPHIHQLSPTFFLPRAAEIEPDAPAIYHVTSNGKTLRRSYEGFAERARGLAFFFKGRGSKRVGLLMPNTPAFLECVFGVGAGGGVCVPVNYRLKTEDISYILDFAEVDIIIVDDEFTPLLDDYKKSHPHVPVIVDTDTDATEGPLSGPFDQATLEGLNYDKQNGNQGWAGLEAQCEDENDTIAVPFTSGTTAKPKGVVYTHRGAYLAALGNVIESGLNYNVGRCRYLWTLPMFHAMGVTFPWAVTAVRGTHYCLRKIDYPLIWKILKEEQITHFNAAPTVNTILCASKAAIKLDHPVRVTVAASPPTAHLFEQMTNLNLFPVHVYGLTETYGPITKGYHMPLWETLPLKEKYTRMARQGHGFLPSLPIRIVKPEQASEGILIDVAKDGKEIGEILFFGNICAKEYLKDPVATQKLFAGGGLHSGDLAVWHPDGSAQILDRAKDIIISGGENISSVALEAMLVQHPGVLEAGVVAVTDERWGERPVAFVTLQSGQELKGEDVVEWAKKESAISRFMVPREVVVVGELPKTSTGKVKKNVLRGWARGDYSEK
ncbi:hypothetical protein HYALB_00006227 [Hymenoscyphus albidus]|uniref:Uncharacterized protein n=1 Tax=Hymenoscyphus albidus TaxID=595503 RepID=A0A9N9LZE2_9HELO|nr:hypothetical protein HYALB_00006227 [Hymenoscyphus albidus]